MWAPELHQIDNVWYMFYSSCDSAQPCCDSCSTRVLRGCDSAGPYDCQFEHLADLIPPEGQRGGRDDNFAFSIDGTFLEVPGFGRYHVLSIRDKEFNQALAITTLDTHEWTVGAWHVISIPDQPWERNVTGAASIPQADLVGVNEAPHVSPRSLPRYHHDPTADPYPAPCSRGRSLALLLWVQLRNAQLLPRSPPLERW